MKIKVCGMKHPQNIEEVSKLAPDYLGFIFYEKSPRYVANLLSSKQLNGLSSTIKKIGVFVNAEEKQILKTAMRYRLDYIQLHGDESPKFCFSLKQKGISIIKAFQIDESFDFSILSMYLNCTDYFLFDTKSADYGGTGKKFNWNLLKEYNNKKPFFLSGGISREDVKTLSENTEITHLNIEALDINSCFETSPGTKNVALISEFIKEIKHELQS